MVKPPIPPKGHLLKLRLSRGGTKNSPEFFINVAQSYRRRDSKFIENLGKYEPIPDSADMSKRIYLNFDRIKYWLGRGAQPTFRVAWLLGKANIIPSIPRGANAFNLSQAQETVEDSKEQEHPIAGKADLDVGVKNYETEQGKL